MRDGRVLRKWWSGSAARILVQLSTWIGCNSIILVTPAIFSVLRSGVIARYNAHDLFRLTEKNLSRHVAQW